MKDRAVENKEAVGSLRVTWFVPVNHRDFNKMPASVWIRCLQLIPYLEVRGIRCRVNDESSHADVAVFVRWQDESAFELAKRMKAKGAAIVFDLCVNYFDEAKVPVLGERVGKELVSQCLRMTSFADAITASSEFIAARAREHHDHVVYLPDSIDVGHFCHTKPSEDFYRLKLRAIWSGVVTKAREIEPLLPLLKKRGITLTVITDTRPRLRQVGSVWRWPYSPTYLQWRHETFPNAILKGEFCVSHRPTEDSYNRGHSFFKIGVFMTEGVPAVASPLPSYLELLDNGGGKVCRSMEEWENTLDTLCQDRSLLEQWSREAHSALEPFYTARIADCYLTLFTNLVLVE